MTEEEKMDFGVKFFKAVGTAMLQWMDREKTPQGKALQLDELEANPETVDKYIECFPISTPTFIRNPSLPVGVMSFSFKDYMYPVRVRP